MAIIARPAATAILLIALVGTVCATPGPGSVAVVYTLNDTTGGALALAQEYAAARSIPANQVCGVPVAVVDQITADAYNATVLTPLRACLGAVEDRIEAIVLTRGIPINVVDVSGQVASLAAMLGVWNSTVAATGVPLWKTPCGRQTLDVGPVTRPPPARAVEPGAADPTYYGAYWENPYQVTGVSAPPTPFNASFVASKQGVNYHLKLVTMLNARSYANASRLITSALAAEANGPVAGWFTMMKAADSARGVLDYEYSTVASTLADMGYPESLITPFNTNYVNTSISFASFFVGTPSLGEAIEGNNYRNGSVVDNLTSYGAVPVNFHPTGESQVSIARWVDKGASSVHGTTAEPLNNVFPSRFLLTDYVGGATIAEAWFRRFPFTYWRSLVLGDPMMAVFASRPTVTLSSSGTSDNCQVTATATPVAGTTIGGLTMYADGEAVAVAVAKDTVTATVPGGTKSVLAVAQLAMGWMSKGWNTMESPC